ncbi:MAG TPA: amino acid adenylation domain-containing protein, partial [Bryobacteraceae bacterium]|nr:amino acid adenylation domain-containing protein [Bryobacteraceae bacterium]
ANNVLLEVGPGQTLSVLARQHPAKSAEQTVASSLHLSREDELRGVLETLGRLWMAGVSVDWPAFYADERRHRVVLPTYPFERKRCWPAPHAVATSEAVAEIARATPIEQPQSEQGREADSAPAEPRIVRLLSGVRTLVQELSGADLTGVDTSAGLLELGLDSLLLTQASQLFQRRFGVPISFRQLMEELSSLDDIASYLDAALPPEAFAPAPAAQPVAATNHASLTPGILEQLLAQQQQLTSQLLQLLGRQPAAQPSAPPGPTAPLLPSPPASENKAHGPFKPIQRGADMVLSTAQSAALDALIARYTKRTTGSKKLAAQNRPILADPRSVAGFKQLWKEMVYPIATTRSDGARVWDVDGNEYIDFVMGFGASLFGHRPPFVIEAIGEQLGKGFEIGPIQPLAGEVAALLTEFTGMPRVGFTNTGSEAVLAATRVARTVTGRDKIAVFAGAYHGIFDEVLFRPLTINGETRTAPIAPGIPSSALDQVIVLDYGNPESLDILRRRGNEIAAVLVEPVQSRRLDLQPREFLRELRRVTLETGTALVFDEVVTGFRVHPGGAQALFGIRADLATYGKVIGGGLPVGVIAGDPKFMDALDGGQWQYGDTSFPVVGVTFFAGTFVRHPLALAAARAVLTHLKQQGPALQNQLAERTARVADQLRAVIEEFAAPYQVAQFSSLIQIGFPADRKFAALLHYMLRDRGIHIYENRAFVMTTAHTDDNLARLVSAFRESLLEMLSGGFLTGHAPAAKIAAASIPAAAPASADDPFPLTEPQKEIWLAAQMGPDAAVAYNESLTLDFRGPFDVDLLRTALHDVVLRHPILLATFSPNGEWQQVKSRDVPEAPLLALDALSEMDRDRELKQIVEGEVSHSFDLTSGPLLRVKIVRLSADRHAVIWTAHHIVCDGWSGGLLVNELATVYSALRRKTRPELPQPASFAGYARATRVDDAASRQSMDYWRHQFSQLPAPLDLPLDRPRPAVRSAQAATRKRILDTALHQSVRRLATQQKTTVVVLLMATLKTLIHRLTGQTDLVIGLGVAGQASLENGCLVGHCVNLLPVRTQLNPEAAFQDHLASVRKNVLDACDHNQSTLGAILQHISAPRTPNRPPLVEIIFNVDRDPGAAHFDGVEFACDRNPKRALHFDLFFNFVDGPRGLYVECDFNTDLFEPATIERWLGHYETLLHEVTADASQPLCRLPVLSETEQRALTTEWCGGAVTYPATRTLHEWFERQVEKTPRARAVTFENEHLTYRELNERANRLAHYLRKLGVAPDALVALYLERSIDLVVGILGILKSGAAYLPIDPVYPKDRVSFMLEDSQAAVLLTRSDLASNLPAHQAKLVCLDSRTDLFDCEPEANPAPVATPDNLAYVIYTSGSTGKPKGTLITHHNVARLMQSTEALYRFNEHDVWTLFHSHAFDFSVWELWGALLYGGRVVVVPYLTSRSPRDFHELLRNERVTVLNQTPSAFRQFIQAEAEQPSAGSLALRYVIFGGEALEMNTLKPWFDRHGDRQPLLVNMYGITETTVHVTARVLSAADLNAGSVIGAPLEDLRLYILDGKQQPVPIGVAGEICVGGDGVGRGYLNRPDLTQQKFLLDRFSGKPGALLYRSGDLARFLPNGDIEYLGRIDDQVKIRGFRIERGEIEAVLSRHESVRQCFVDVREETPGEKTLVAWFVPRLGSTPSVADLRVHLRQALPDYMVPSAFVSMERLPLTSNGKIDRKALPLPGERTVDPDHQFVAPRDPVEQVLARIWSKVLKVNRVGLRDNFFDLGGHSLLAVRIIVEIERVYGKRLPLATLLRAPTIGDLADILRKESWRPSWSSLVPIRPGGSRTPLFLFHSHGGNVLEYHPLANRLDADQPVYALQARGLDGNIPKGRTLEAMAADYLAEVKTLQPAGPYVLGGFCFGGLLAIEAARQLRAAGDDVALVVVIQTVHPAAARFKPDTTWLRRSWYRGAKRFDLERENLLYRGKGYFRERGRRLVDIAVARTQIAFHGLNGNGQAHADGRSTPYILESLAIEHDRIFDKYRPQPYSGDVLLFRAEKQLRGLVAGPALGWNDVIDGHLDVCEIPGHQQNILLEPNVSRLAGELE